MERSTRTYCGHLSADTTTTTTTTQTSLQGIIRTSAPACCIAPPTTIINLDYHRLRIASIRLLPFTFHPSSIVATLSLSPPPNPHPTPSPLAVVLSVPPSKYIHPTNLGRVPQCRHYICLGTQGTSHWEKRKKHKSCRPE